MSTKTENFNKADEDPFSTSNFTRWDGTNWGRISSNKWASNANATYGLFWIASDYTFDPDQYSKATIHGATTTQEKGVIARATAGVNGYAVYRSDDTHIRLSKFTSGSETNFQNISDNYVDGEELKIVCDGTDIKAYKNGSQVGTTQVDATFNSGQPGFMNFSGNGTTFNLDNWEGSDDGFTETIIIDASEIQAQSSSFENTIIKEVDIISEIQSQSSNFESDIIITRDLSDDNEDEIQSQSSSFESDINRLLILNSSELNAQSSSFEITIRAYHTDEFIGTAAGGMIRNMVR